jgi:hypothetical protein
MAGPDHADYWDAWSNVLDNAEWDEGSGPTEYKCWRLEQDGDLFGVVVQHGQTDIEVIDE